MTINITHVFVPKFATLSQQYNETPIMIVCSSKNIIEYRSSTIKQSHLAVVWYHSLLLPSSHLITLTVPHTTVAIFTLTFSMMLYVWHNQCLHGYNPISLTVVAGKFALSIVPTLLGCTLF